MGTLLFYFNHSVCFLGACSHLSFGVAFTNSKTTITPELALVSDVSLKIHLFVAAR